MNPITPASALQYPVAPPASQELAEAAQQAPQAAAERDAKLAETKLAGQQAALSSLAQYANMPGIESGPLGQKLLAQHAKAAGIDLPMNPMGGIDIGKLRGMFAAPLQDWNQIDAKEKAAQLALPPGERTNYANAPEDWQTRSAVSPLAAATEKLYADQIGKAEAAIGKGQGPQQARGLYSAVMNAYNGMISHGQNDEAEALAKTYLNEARTGLSDQWIEQKAGELVDAQITNLHKLGIFRDDEIKMRQEMIDEKKREWNNLSAYQKGELSVQDRRLSQQAAQFNSKISIMMGNLNARWASVQNARDNIGLRQTALGANMYSRMLTSAAGEMRTAHGQLSQTLVVLNGMSQNPKMRNTQQFIDLTNQATALQDFLTTNGPILEQEEQTANQGMASVMSNITGNPSQVINPPNLQPLKLQIQVQQGQQPAPPAASGQAQPQKTASRADIEAIAKKYGKSVDQVIRDYYAHGYTVQ